MRKKTFAISQAKKKLKAFGERLSEDRTKVTGRDNRPKFKVVEARAYDLLFKKLGDVTKVWDCCRISEDFADYCKKEGIEYDGIPRTYRKFSFVTGCGDAGFEDWDGDIICGLICNQHALDVFNCFYPHLKEGKRLAILAEYSLLESESRYRNLFKYHPDFTMYVSPTRYRIGYDGSFEKSGNPGWTYSCSTRPYAWFVWKKGYTGDGKPRIEFFDSFIELPDVRERMGDKAIALNLF